MNKNQQPSQSPNYLRRVMEVGKDVGAMVAAAAVAFGSTPAALASHETSTPSDAPDAPLIQAGHNSTEVSKTKESIYTRYKQVVNEVLEGKRPGGFANCAVAIFAPAWPNAGNREADVNHGFDDNHTSVYPIKPGYVEVVTVPLFVMDGVLPEDTTKTPDLKIIFSDIKSATFGQTAVNSNPELMFDFSLNYLNKQKVQYKCFPYENATMKTQIVKAENHGGWLYPHGFHSYTAAGYVMNPTQMPASKLNSFLTSNGFQTKSVPLPRP